MGPLHCPGNVKVHFAGGEVQNQYLAAQTLGVNHALYTCYPWVERMIFEKPKSPIMPLKWQRPETGKTIPNYIAENQRHVIQDSGLFTLMFGSQNSATKDEKLLNRWYDGLVRFTVDHGAPVTCVEVDCQKLLGPAKAWEFRERLRRDLPAKNRIINVFHLEDGQKGLDRLIEYSDYIAISVPELRFANRKNMVPNLARYIKQRKPGIDLHLLGCTELKLLQECKFATSADSTTWISGKRWGFLKGHYIRDINHERIIEIVGQKAWDIIREYNSPANTDFLCASLYLHMDEYARYAGPQNYKPILKYF